MSILAISPVTLGDSGVYTCQSGTMSDSGAVANVTVIVTSGKQNKLTSMNNNRSIMSNFIKQLNLDHLVLLSNSRPGRGVGLILCF